MLPEILHILTVISSTQYMNVYKRGTFRKNMFLLEVIIDVDRV